MINNDESVAKSILEKHEIEFLSQLTEDQYISIRDELRLLNVAAVQEKNQEPKSA